MRVLLVNPPIPNYQESPAPPLGLAYIAAILGRESIDVSILDLAPLGDSLLPLASALDELQPNIVGVTCVSANFPRAVHVAQRVKEYDNRIRVIAGGPHVTYEASRLLAENTVLDVIVKGEAEATILLVVRNIQKGQALDSVPGIAFREGRRIVEGPAARLIEDLDAIPVPARHLLPMHLYAELTASTSVITQRGCPYSCWFCPTTAFWRHRARIRSVSGVIDEVRDVKRTYGIDEFYFVDDTFTFHRKRTELLLSQLQGLNVQWACNTRTECLSRKLLGRMAAAGCKRITLGIESASSELRERIGKGSLNRNQLCELIDGAKESGIAIKMNLMFGLPGETVDDIRENIRLVRDLEPAYATYSMLSYFPGTQVELPSRRAGDGAAPRNGGSPSPLGELSSEEIWELIADIEREFGVEVQRRGGF